MEDQSQTRTLSLQAAYSFGAEHGLENEIRAIRDMEIEWDRSYTSSLRRGYIVELFESQGIFDSFKERHWSYGDTPAGQTLRRRFIRIKQQYEDFLARVDPLDNSLEDELFEDRSFAAESDLRDFLAKNLSLIEQGLTLAHHDGRVGIEYPIAGGRIDILAKDINSQYVVIELKLSRGREKALGQILYYMGWVDKYLDNPPCRGVIIARDIPEELILAVARVQGVPLFQYQLNVTLNQVRP
jgi:hypothetical protein